MYLGRFLVVGPGVGAYRVSSRSFPNRELTSRDGRLTVAPTAEADPTDNPYVSYNCLRTVDPPAGAAGPDAGVVLGNGSHVDPVAEKIDLGYPARDALADGLLTLDYEKDDYDTPRIAGVVGPEAATIGVVRRDALIVETVDEPTLVATYEKDSPEPYPLDADTAAGAARELYEAEFEHRVCAAAATVADGVETAAVNE